MYLFYVRAWGLSWKPLSLKNNIDFRLGRHVEEDLVERDHADLGHQFGLAKSFDRMRWPLLWHALSQQGV